MGSNGTRSKAKGVVRKREKGEKPHKTAKKSKEPPIDGLGPKNLKQLHKAVRQVWSWSQACRLVRLRSMGADGFPRCENKKCLHKGGPVPKIAVDHIDPVGEVGGPDWIKRMFTPSKNLQALCKECHKEKTKEERSCKVSTKKLKFSDQF